MTKRYLYSMRFKFDIKAIDNIKNKFVLEIKDFDYIVHINIVLEVVESVIVNMNGYFPSEIYLYDTFNSSSFIHKIWDNNMWDFLIKNSINYSRVEIQFEDKFNDIYTPETNILYHFTNNDYVPKISRIGLVPKSKNKLSIHRDRIYFTDTLADAEKLLNPMLGVIVQKKINNPKNTQKPIFAILEVDVSNLLIDGKPIVFRKDPNYTKGDCFYTTSNIPPDRISVLKIIK